MSQDFIAFLNDDASAVTVREWVDRQGLAVDTVRSGGAAQFSQWLDSAAPPKLAIVDLDGQAEPVQMAARLVSLCGPASRLVGVGSANDVSLYRSIMAAGLTDYLVKPLQADTLGAALAQAQKGGPGAAKETREAKIVVLIGARGGVGASTLAVNLGWIAAHEIRRKCVVLDLDLQYGTTALALDLEPGRGLRDILASPQRVDSLMVSSAVTAESANLALLGAEESLTETPLVDPNAVVALTKELKVTHGLVLVDMPRALIASQKRLLTMAHDVVLVAPMTLAGIRDTLRLRTALASFGVQGRVTLVATGVGAQRPAAIAEDPFTKGIQARIDFTVPDDPATATAASNAGKSIPALAPTTPLAKVLRQLAQHLAGSGNGDDKKADLPFWKRLFGAPGKSAAPAKAKRP